MISCGNDGKTNKVGICVKTEQLKSIEKLKADYVELPFAGVADLSQEEFEDLHTYLESRNIECPVMTQLLPKKARIVDQDNAFFQYESFLKEGFLRIRKLNTKLIVLGNAGARNYYEGSETQAMIRLICFCFDVAKLAAEYGITICLEPLNRTQSNIINTLEEAVGVAKIVQMPNFGVVWDYFHYQVEKDNLEALQKNTELLKHCHTADILYRGIPQIQNQTEMLGFLKKIEYKGNISLEFDKLPSDTERLNQAISELKVSLGA